MTSAQDAIEYLEYILQKWKKISNNDSVLYSTYSPNNVIERCDIYDNSLLANCLICLSDTPHPIAVSILNFFAGTYQYFVDNNEQKSLISAAYTSNNGNFTTCYDFSCTVQDIGNNAMAGIALTKFCIKYPTHKNTPKYLDTLVYLVKSINELKCETKVINQYEQGKPVIGYRGRVNNSYVSTEHMIDLYALTNMMGNLTMSTTLKNMVDDMKQNSKIFVVNMYKNSVYAIGCKEGCGDLNEGTAQPVDTITWNMLAGVDNNKKRKKDSLTIAASSRFSIPFSNNVIGGIKFSENSNCAQYENTGAFLCALSEYKYIFNEEIKSDTSKDMIDFIQTKINKKEPFQSAYGKFNNNLCQTGLGWGYFTTPHLASTIYCLMANIAQKDPTINIYRYYGNHSGKENCAKEGENVNDSSKFDNYPVKCCNGKNPLNQDNKMICPLDDNLIPKKNKTIFYIILGSVALITLCIFLYSVWS